MSGLRTELRAAVDALRFRPGVAAAEDARADLLVAFGLGLMVLAIAITTYLSAQFLVGDPAPIPPIGTDARPVATATTTP